MKYINPFEKWGKMHKQLKQLLCPDYGGKTLRKQRQYAILFSHFKGTVANKDGAQADTDVKAQWRPSSTAAACTHHCDDYALHHCWRGGASTLKGRDVDKEKDGDTLAKVSQPVSLHLYSTYRGAANRAEFFDWNWQGRFFTHAFICMFIIHLHCFLAHFHKRELHSYGL